MGRRFEVHEWPLPEWQPGVDVLKRHRRELLEHDYKLVVFLLASEYDKNFVADLRDALERLNELNYPTYFKEPLFLGVAFQPPPSDLSEIPSVGKSESSWFNVVSELSRRAVPADRGLTLEQLKQNWHSFAASMARATYFLAAHFRVPLDELPVLLLLDPDNVSEAVAISLRGRRLLEVYTDLRQIFSEWTRENAEAIAQHDAIKALKTRNWRHPLMSGVERDGVVRTLSGAVMQAARDAGADTADVSRQFQNCLATPLNVPRLTRLLRNNSLVLSVDGKAVDSASLADFYEQELGRAVAGELSRFRADLSVPPFPLERLRRSGARRAARIGAPPDIVSTVEDAYLALEDNFAGIELFVSYCHQDRSFKNELEKHLAAAKRSGLIRVWHDGLIDGGGRWRRAIHEHLHSADVIILLVSADFLSSKYCWEVELKQALLRQERSEVPLIPVIVRPADWRDTALGEMQALPRDGIAITEWPNRDRAFLDVVDGIRTVAERIIGERQRKAG